QAQSTPTASERSPGPLLDIARIVPYPADFGDAIPGIGFLDGRFYTLEEEAARTAAANGAASAADVRDMERRLAEAGWLQRYESRLAAPSADNPDNFSVQFSSFVVEYASRQDAQAAYGSLVSGDAASQSQAETVGDESSLTQYSDVTPDTGAKYQAARLVFRLGPVLAVIVFADLTDQPPDLALLDSVARGVAGRGAIVLARGSEALASM